MAKRRGWVLPFYLYAYLKRHSNSIRKKEDEKERGREKKLKIIRLGNLSNTSNGEKGDNCLNKTKNKNTRLLVNRVAKVTWKVIHSLHLSHSHT